MMEKLQGMMAYFGERNKMARGRQEDVLRMLRAFMAETNNARERLLEKKAREEKAAAKAGKRQSASEKQAPAPMDTDPSPEDQVAVQHVSSLAEEGDIGAKDGTTTE